MITDFKVYKRKIHVYVRQPGEAPSSMGWMYLRTTNAYPTCKAAALAASVGKGTHLQFKALFAKD